MAASPAWQLLASATAARLERVMLPRGGRCAVQHGVAALGWLRPRNEFERCLLSCTVARRQVWARFVWCQAAQRAFVWWCR